MATPDEKKLSDPADQSWADWSRDPNSRDGETQSTKDETYGDPNQAEREEEEMRLMRSIDPGNDHPDSAYFENESDSDVPDKRKGIGYRIRSLLGFL